MKGPILARRLGVAAYRRGWIIDNDVLVRRSDVARAVQALGALGYAPRPYLSLESQLAVHFHTALYRVDNDVTVPVEVHWSPFRCPLYPENERLVWQHTELLDVGSRPVRVFDPPLTVVHLASHFVHHRASESRILRDVAWAWNKWQPHIDRSELHALAKAFRLDHALAYSLHIAAERSMLDAPPPFDTTPAQWLRRLVSAEDVTEVQQPRHDYARMLAMLVIAPPERVPRWLWNLVFPPIDVMASIYDRPATPALYLRYFTRLFRPIGRRMGRIK